MCDSDVVISLHTNCSIDIILIVIIVIITFVAIKHQAEPATSRRERLTRVATIAQLALAVGGHLANLHALATPCARQLSRTAHWTRCLALFANKSWITLTSCTYSKGVCVCNIETILG